MKMAYICYLIILVDLAFGLQRAQSSDRLWTDITGKYSAQATFVKLAGETVELRKNNGAIVHIALSKLCYRDQAWVKRVDTQQVVAEGLGESQKEALEDAFRRAVQQVTGTLLDAETLVKNDDLVYDKILTLSEGFITTYDELGQRREGDLIRVQIMATVRRRDLLDSISRARCGVDRKSLDAEAYTKLQRRQSALLLLQKALDDFPGRLLRVSFAHNLESANDSNVTMEHRVTISIDENNYALTQERLAAVLEPLARHAGTVKTVCLRLPQVLRPRGATLFHSRFGISDSPGTSRSDPLTAEFAELERTACSRLEGRLPDQPSDYQPEGSSTLIVMNVRPGSSHSTAQWRYFEIDARPRIPDSRLRLAIQYYDKSNQSVYRREVMMGPGVPGISASGSGSAGDRLQTVVIAPFFVWCEGSGYSNDCVVMFSRSLTLRGEATLSASEFSRIKSAGAEAKDSRYVE